MSNKSKQWGAIIVMIALFAMIAFVTNLCSPMAIIVKNQFGASNLESQIGNYGNFIAYLVMGIPSGMLIKKIGYKSTALLALVAVDERLGKHAGLCIRSLSCRCLHRRFLYVYA